MGHCHFSVAAMTMFFFLSAATVILVSSHPMIPGNPWEPFHNLSGCHAGEHRDGLAQLKQYLHQFGYIPTPGDKGFSDDFDDALESALLTYQHNFHLNTTGSLDHSTLDVMVQPRCGVADVVNGTTTMMRGRNLYTYFPGTPMWSSDKRKLTYAFSSTSAVSISQSVLRKVFARAFTRWAEVTTLSFSEATSTDQADITIGFFRGDHGDGESFDGPLGTLAHAFSPTDGRLHLDAAEQWVAAEGDVASSALFSSSVAVDLESVAVHEIGHLLGLGHSSVEGTIMYPTIRSGTRKVQLEADDVSGIQSLYGRNPSYNGTSTTSTGRTKTVTEMDANGGGLPLGAGRTAVIGVVAALAVAFVVLVL